MIYESLENRFDGNYTCPKNDFMYIDPFNPNATTWFEYNVCDLTDFTCSFVDGSVSWEIQDCSDALYDKDTWMMATNEEFRKWAWRNGHFNVLRYFDDYHDIDWGCNSTMACNWEPLDEEGALYKYHCENECGDYTCEDWVWSYEEEDWMVSECPVEWDAEMAFAKSARLARGYDETIGKAVDAFCPNGSCVVNATTALVMQADQLNVTNWIDSVLGDAGLMDIMQSAVNETQDVFGDEA